MALISEPDEFGKGHILVSQKFFQFSQQNYLQFIQTT